MSKQTKTIMGEDHIPRFVVQHRRRLTVPATPVLHPGTGQPVGPGIRRARALSAPHGHLVFKLHLASV
jgi:hypothetical protein